VIDFYKYFNSFPAIGKNFQLSMISKIIESPDQNTCEGEAKTSGQV